MTLQLVQQTSNKLSVLLNAIELKLKGLWGKELKVHNYQGLTERISCVGRLHISGKDAKYTSLIVKHIQLEMFPAATLAQVPQELREEYLCYQYLTQQRQKFDLFAELYGFDERGFLLLQDLSLTQTSPVQGNASNLPGEELNDIACKVADTLAALHQATFGQQLQFEPMRRDAGLPGFADDARSYSLAAHRRRYRLGAATVLDYADIMNITIPGTWHQYVDLMEADMEQPGRFHCFVHDDLANQRQTIERNGKFYLVDFENAKFSHALLDLCKPLAGKFEMLLTTGEFFYANPNFPDSFIDHYRTNLFTKGNISIPQSEWESAFTHALLYHCLALIGKLVEISAQRRLRKAFALDLCTVISRHLKLCSLFNHHTPVTGVLRKLMERTYRPEFQRQAQ